MIYETLLITFYRATSFKFGDRVTKLLVYYIESMIHRKHDTVGNSLLEIFFVLRMRYNNSIFQETKLPLKMHRPIFRLLFVVPTKFTARRTAYHAIYEANEISLRQKFGYTYNFQTYRDDATLNQQRKQ